jgi:PIN domain nuclease of toxin-antitoxin system
MLPPSWRRDLVQAGFSWLAISDVHAARAAALPLHHRDPWDRIIVAQALDEGLTIVSGDRQMQFYGAPMLW